MTLEFENGVIKTLNIEYDENCGGIGKVYFNSFKQNKERIAVINSGTDEFYTYAEYLEKCTRTAITLRKQGYKNQDSLCICSEKENINANVPVIAGQFLGMTTFSIDPTLTVNECIELMEQVQPKILFTTEMGKDMLTRVFKILSLETKLVFFGKEFQDRYLQYQEGEETFEPIFISNLYETCVIHFSSGSTGLPKAICLNHYYFLGLRWMEQHSLLEACNKQFANKPMGKVSLRFANWYWVSTSFELIIYASTGACRILWEHFDERQIWKVIERYSVTNLCLTPLECIELAESKKPEGVDISNVIDISTGGYILPKDYINSLRELFPGAHICQMYGMTECGVATTFDKNIPRHVKLLAIKPSSCGLPVPGLYYKVIDVDTGRKCGPNQPGELYLKGKGILNGFYNRDASESFDNEGYFKTGDLVTFDEDFCFYILDRIKSVLGWNDWLIYPSHIEKVLLEHPSVYNAVVIGIPHRTEGERLMGVVELRKDGPKVTENELVQYVDNRVEDHKRLREGLKFVNKFPVTITGKVNRIKIKEMIINNLDI